MNQFTLPDLQFVLALLFLICGISLIFGFFTKVTALILILCLITLWLFSSNPIDSQAISLLSLQPAILAIAGLVTLFLVDSGHLSLENYFGFK